MCFRLLHSWTSLNMPPIVRFILFKVLFALRQDK